MDNNLRKKTLSVLYKILQGYQYTDRDKDVIILLPEYQFKEVEEIIKKIEGD